jgi:allantoin racemase
MRILVVYPILFKEEFESSFKGKNFVRKDTIVDYTFIEYGPSSIESVYDAEIAAPFIIRKIEAAEKNGYDAAVISCMLDPGVRACKEAVSIPVIGAREASYAIATLLGDKISTVYPEGIPVLNLQDNPERTFQILRKNAQRALKDGAQVLILGCTGLTGMASKLQKELGVPVLEPEGCALKIAEMLVDLGIAQSKITYPKPVKKMRKLPNSRPRL